MARRNRFSNVVLIALHKIMLAYPLNYPWSRQCYSSSAVVISGKAPRYDCAERRIAVYIYNMIRVMSTVLISENYSSLLILSLSPT